MAFARGDRVHLAGVGTGIIREPRGADRYAIDIKGRLVIASDRDLEPAAGGASRKPRAVTERAATHVGSASTAPPPSLDLHGKTVAESLEALGSFIDDAVRAGHQQALVIHGRSGGKVKSAVHRFLRALSVVRTFRVDPRNDGATIVSF